MTLPAQVSTHPDPDGPTPSQTIGPFFRFGMDWWEAQDLAAPGSPDAVVLAGRVLDGAGDAVPDAMIEIWQADGRGRLGGGPPGDGGPADGAAGSPAWSGFGRSLTDHDGRYRFTTVIPGPVDDRQAPHIAMTVFARGLLQRLVTRVYLPGHPANPADPVLAGLDPARRGTLVARGEEFPHTSELTFDVRLQGEGETVFFVW